MSAAATVIQLAGIVLAPLLPGSIQSMKARLQGRHGASLLQPYRTLMRLWGKSAVDPEGTGPVYRIAPALVAACMLAAVAIVPIAGRAGALGLGDDALVLIGVLALSRFALAMAAWDTGNAFALMACARDLMIAVFGEALLVLAMLLVALPAHGTDLATMSSAAAGTQIWNGPAHWCGALAFALVILVETGRQPIDNPDTHLELTMIHEGPLLEYGGRDLALLTWAGAARHWVFIVLGAELYLPHPAGFAAGLLTLTASVAVLCCALAVAESAQAKMRILRVPALLGVGCAIAIAGAGMWIGGVGV
jgi:formate hydrogenlyase subunit 4